MRSHVGSTSAAGSRAPREAERELLRAPRCACCVSPRVHLAKYIGSTLFSDDNPATLRRALPPPSVRAGATGCWLRSSSLFGRPRVALFARSLTMAQLHARPELALLHLLYFRPTDARCTALDETLFDLAAQPSRSRAPRGQALRRARHVVGGWVSGSAPTVLFVRNAQTVAQFGRRRRRGTSSSGCSPRRSRAMFRAK